MKTKPFQICDLENEKTSTIALHKNESQCFIKVTLRDLF